MTVSSSTSRVSYNGNGSTTVFAYTFRVFDQDDLTVIIRSANGTETVKTITTHYTVSGVGGAGGGNVTMLTAPASGETLVIIREQDLIQELDIVPNDPFPASSVEDALDKLTFMVQQHEETLGRTIKASRTNTISNPEFTASAASRANKLFAFDSTGNNLTIAQEIGTYRGNWSASTAYQQRDLVKDTSTGNIFICITAHTSSGTQPITTNADSAKWDLILDVAAFTTLYDQFDDRYLGAKNSDPSVDNDGNTLIDGALYWNTTDNRLKVYDLGGTAWKFTAPSPAEQSNINTVAGIAADISAVAGDATDIGTVAADLTGSNTIGTVSGIAANVTTVAGISANVTTVAGISANVTTVAGISSDVTTVAANVAGVTSFAEKYRVGSADPSTSLDEGDLFYNTTSNLLKVYNGSAWETGVTPGSGFLSASNNLSDLADAATARDNLDLGSTDSVSFAQVDILAQGDLRLQDTTGGQYVALQAPGTVATSYTLTLPAADGTSGQVIQTNGSGGLSFANSPAPYPIQGTRVFATSGSFTPPATGEYVVYVVGGGGSGAAHRGTTDGTATGGAAGGLAIKKLTLSSSVTYTVTVGAGGAAITVATANTSTNGNAGGASSFSGSGITTITANGGSGGTAGTTDQSGASGGSASGGDYNITGGGSGATFGNNTATGGGAVGWYGVGYSSGTATATGGSTAAGSGGAGVGAVSANANNDGTGGGGSVGTSSSSTGGIGFPATNFANASSVYWSLAPINATGAGGSGSANGDPGGGGSGVRRSSSGGGGSAGALAGGGAAASTTTAVNISGGFGLLGGGGGAAANTGDASTASGKGGEGFVLIQWRGV